MLIDILACLLSCLARSFSNLRIYRKSINGEANLCQQTPGIIFFQSLLKRSRFASRAPSSFLNSSTFRLINPRSCIAKSDVIRQILTAGEVKGLDDEAILAAFTKGFFGGFVFYPEEVLLRLGAYRLFSGDGTGSYPWDSNMVHRGLIGCRPRQRIFIKPTSVERSRNPHLSS